MSGARRVIAVTAVGDSDWFGFLFSGISRPRVRPPLRRCLEFPRIVVGVIDDLGEEHIAKINDGV